MTTKRQAVTAAELAVRSDDGVRRELERGEVLVMSPTGGRHGRVAAEIAYRLIDFNKRNGRPGEVLVGDVGMLLQRDPDTLRAPDVGFFLKAHLPGGEVPVGFFEGVAPDLVVEVISPSDRPGAVLAKAAEWLQGGAQLVWLVDPEGERVLVLRAGRDLRELPADAQLDAEPVLAGFGVPVSELFV